MGYFNIEFLRRPELSPLSPKAGYAVGLGAVANSVKDIADIGLNRQKLDDENKRYQEEKLFRNDELNFRKNAHADTMKARGDELAYQKDKDEKDRIFNEKKLSIDELRANRDRAVDMARVNTQANYYNTLAQEHADKIERQKREDTASAEEIRRLFPNETKGKSDAEVLAVGSAKQRFSKNRSSVPNDINIPEGYSYISADELSPFVGKGLLQNGGLKKLKDGNYLIENETLLNMIDVAKQQQGIAKFLNERKNQVKGVLDDVVIAPNEKRGVIKDNQATKQAPMLDMKYLKKQKPLIFNDEYDGAL
ncbi:hypothetical protein [uncultured Campylobacter sp.]|uniref:hypothetical protein n=1 Tax=uncultured Campylobacter sp. TaxID=218934 RepID=UPI0015BDDC9A|nr:hypothetical protein [uncultured Campylobacter sp.]